MYDLYEKLLTERETTSYQVAKATGISNSTLSDWKTGKSTPKLDKLVTIANYFDIPVGYFAECFKKSAISHDQGA